MSVSRIFFVTGVAVLCAVLCLVPVSAYHINTTAEGLLDEQGCYIGAYLGGNTYTSGPDNGYESWIQDPAAFNTATGKTHRLFSRYVSLGNSLNGNENQDGKSASAWASDIITKYDAVPVIFVTPWDSGLNMSYLYPNGNTTQEQIDALANELAPLTNNGENTIIIIFGHEMESQQMCQDNPQAFISMFQYAADQFHGAHCQVAWCTNINDNPFTADNKIQWWPGSENTYYPGSKPGKDYVDWVAQTRYHFWWGANTFTGLKGEFTTDPSHAWYNYFGNTLGFPLMFAETAGQKPAPYPPNNPAWDPNPLNKPTQDFSAQWIPSLYNAQNLKTNYPRIKAVIWFDTDKYNDNGQPEQNYLIPPGAWVSSSSSVSPLSGPAYNAGISDPYFLGSTGFSGGDTPGEALAADFEVTPAQGPAPLTVQCTDKSSGDPMKWVYEFGDGTISMSKNPSHTYRIPGAYTITLTVMKQDRSNGRVAVRSSMATNAVTVTGVPFVPPVAKFAASPTSGPAPLKVNFTDQSTGSPTTYVYNFGDGTTITGKNPVHTYRYPGTYTVTLNVIKRDPGTGAIVSDTSVMEDLITVL